MEGSFSAAGEHRATEGGALGADANHRARVGARRLISAPDASQYNANYYGVGAGQPTANYRNYSRNAIPHWASPLAQWLLAYTAPAWLDLGGAYGHLVAAVIAQGGAPESRVVEWSQFAYTNRVTEAYIHGDVRRVIAQMSVDDRKNFGTVVSLDFLEHIPEQDGADLIAELCGGYPAAIHVHVIGAHNPAEDLSNHLADPTHANHQPISWYHEQYALNGWRVDEVRTALLREVPDWAQTDWHDRIVAYERVYRIDTPTPTTTSTVRVRRQAARTPTSDASEKGAERADLSGE